MKHNKSFVLASHLPEFEIDMIRKILSFLWFLFMGAFYTLGQTPSPFPIPPFSTTTYPMEPVSAGDGDAWSQKLFKSKDNGWKIRVGTFNNERQCVESFNEFDFLQTVIGEVFGNNVFTQPVDVISYVCISGDGAPFVDVAVYPPTVDYQSQYQGWNGTEFSKGPAINVDGKYWYRMHVKWNPDDDMKGYNSYKYRDLNSLLLYAKTYRYTGNGPTPAFQLWAFNHIVRPELDLTVQKQKMGQWCWAAVTASIHKYYNPASSVTQCDLANDAFDQQTCCQPDMLSDPNKPSACNQGYDISKSLGRYELFKKGLAHKYVQGYMKPEDVKPYPGFQELQDEINNKRPVVLSFELTEPGQSTGFNHFVVLTGAYVEGSGKQMVILKDPLNPGKDGAKDGTTTMPYSALPNGYRPNEGLSNWTDYTGQWTQTMFINH